MPVIITSIMKYTPTYNYHPLSSSLRLLNWSQSYNMASPAVETPASISAILSSVFLNTFLLPSRLSFPYWQNTWMEELLEQGFKGTDTNICDKTAWPFKKING